METFVEKAILDADGMMTETTPAQVAAARSDRYGFSVTQRTN